MKEQYQALSDHSITIATAYKNKESKARQDGRHEDADNFQGLAKHHKNESSKYLAAMEAL